jgi:hypothetical protein
MLSALVPRATWRNNSCILATVVDESVLGGCRFPISSDLSVVVNTLRTGVDSSGKSDSCIDPVTVKKALVRPVIIAPNNLSFGIYTQGERNNTAWRINGCISVVAVKEAVRVGDTLVDNTLVGPDHLPIVIDCEGICVGGSWKIEQRIRTTVIGKTMAVICTIIIETYYLAMVVDAVWLGEISCLADRLSCRHRRYRGNRVGEYRCSHTIQ